MSGRAILFPDPETIMDTKSYDRIAPNIDRVEVDGSQVKVYWKCPATGRSVGDSTAWMAADSSMGARMGASVKRSIVSEIVYSIARFIANLLPGAAGRVISNATYTAANDVNYRATSGVDFTESSRRAAIATAFESVEPSFVWDEKRGQYIAR
jgi:hypothetical protein